MKQATTEQPATTLPAEIETAVRMNAEWKQWEEEAERHKTILAEAETDFASQILEADFSDAKALEKLRTFHMQILLGPRKEALMASRFNERRELMHAAKQVATDVARTLVGKALTGTIELAALAARGNFASLEDAREAMSNVTGATKFRQLLTTLDRYNVVLENTVMAAQAAAPEVERLKGLLPDGRFPTPQEVPV